MENYPEQSVQSKLVFVSISVLVGLLLLGIGYVGGYFTPGRTDDSSRVPSTSWKDGPCSVITGSQCPAG